MAKDLNDGENWLPTDFLTDDDILRDYKATSKFSRELDAGAYSPFDIPIGVGSLGASSDLSSPMESVVSSAETESDEEDYLAGLTQKMAQSTLQDDQWNLGSGFGYESQMSWGFMEGSPQSTMCDGFGGCCCKKGSGSGSPNCPSRVSSPLAAAPINRRDAAWDLLYAAAGELARMRMLEEANGYYQNRGLLGGPRKHSHGFGPLKSQSSDFGLRSHDSLSYKKLQLAHFLQLKQQQMMKQQGSPVWGQTKTGGLCQQNHHTHQMAQAQNRLRNAGRSIGLSPSVWPALQQPQQQPGSGMRAVFLGNTGSKRERTGTGVFLPRSAGVPAETRKKSACSTVFLPDRVVQALNLNLDAMAAQNQIQSRSKTVSNPDCDVALKYGNALPTAQKGSSIRPKPVNQEARLPHEWIY